MPNDLNLLRDQAYQQLLDLIIRGELTPDMPLSERKLAERLSLSRTPVREALRALVREGVVTAQLGRGTFVREVSSQDILAVYEVRQALECMAARLAAIKGPSRTLEELAIQLDYMREQHHQYSETEIDEMGRRVHQAIFESACNAVLSETFAPLRRRFQVAFGLTRHYERPALQDTLAEHARIVQAIRQRNPQEAEAAMREHLEHGLQARMRLIHKGESPVIQETQ